MKKALLLILSLGFAMSMQATHLMGGYITVTCSDDPNTSQLEYNVDTYLIHDLAGIQSPSSINVAYNGGTVNMPKTSSFVITLGTYQAEVAVYQGSVGLQPNSTYDFSYSSCCRSQGFVNITGSPAFYFNTIVSTGAGCNSSPVIISPPALNWPQNIPWATAFTAGDPDMDLLTFALDTPYSAAATPVQYSVSAPAPGMPMLDSATGLFTFQATSTGFYGFAYYIYAFDASGMMTSKTRVDFPIGVVPPPNSGNPNLITINPPSTVVNNQAYFRMNNSDTIQFGAVCDTDLVAEVFYPSMVDSNSVYINIQSFKQGGQATVDFSWMPTSMSAVTEFPVVVRFSAPDYDFSKDFTFVAKSQNDVGQVELEPIQAVLYPNPSSGAFTVEFEEPMKSFNIVDSRGRVVHRGAIAAGSLSLELNLNIDNGVYFIQLENEDGLAKVLPVIIK